MRSGRTWSLLFVWVARPPRPGDVRRIVDAAYVRVSVAAGARPSAPRKHPVSGVGLASPMTIPDCRPRAEVRAHGQVTRYRCGGSGRPVLVLASPAAPAPFPPGFLDALERGHRVIVPEPPPEGVDLVEWMAHFLEGVGIRRVRIVAADRFCVPALELALLDPDQVACLVLHWDGPLGSPDAGGTLEMNGPGGRVPLLIVHGASTGELMVQIDAFLAADGVASHA